MRFDGGWLARITAALLMVWLAVCSVPTATAQDALTCTTAGEACGRHATCEEYEHPPLKTRDRCACDRGYLGDRCQHMCPMFGDSSNAPARVCSGRGECVLDPAGSSAMYDCADDSQAYGDACQNVYGQ